MKKLSILSMLILSSLIFGKVGIGTTDPDASAILELKSSDRGLLITRVSLTGTNDISTIPNPSNGLFVYNLYDAGTGTSKVFADSFYKFNSSLGKWDLLISEESLNNLLIPVPASFPIRYCY